MLNYSAMASAVGALSSPCVSPQFERYSGLSDNMVAHNRISSWDAVLSMELNTLCSLKTGWDGYNSPPVKFENAERVLNFLSLFKQMAEYLDYSLKSIIPDNPPHIVPVSGGALQAEWHLKHGYYMEFFFDNPCPIEASFYNYEGNVNEELSIDDTHVQINFVPIFNWLKQVDDIDNAQQRDM